MHWNYRVFKQDGSTKIVNKDGILMPPVPAFYFVGECYYDDNDKPEMHSNMDHNLIHGDTVDEVKENLAMIMEAFDAPVIELDEDGKFKS